MSLAVLPSDERIHEACRQYHADGFGVVRGLFTAEEIGVLSHEADQLLKRADLIETNNLRCRWQTDIQTDACLFDAFDPVIDIGAEAARLAGDPRLQAILRGIHGEPGQLFKDKLIYKPPGASGYALHQDYIAWPSFPRSFLTMLVPLDPADALSGCVEVFPGLHRQGAIMPEDGLYHEIPLDRVDESRGVKLQLSPGDVGFFSGFTPHRSASNRSRHWRRQLYLSYNASSDGGNCREAHYQEFHAWLRERYAEYGRTEVYFS